MTRRSTLWVFAAGLLCAAGALCAAPAPAGAAGGPVTISSGPVRGQPPPPQPSTAPAPPLVPKSRLQGAWHRACDGDVRTFCLGLRAPAAITQCLDRHTAQLSAACKDVRAQEAQQRRMGR